MKYIAGSAFVIFVLLSSGIVLAQPVLSTKNLALGGGGTAYLTGYEANFINPANLMIRSRKTNLSLGLGEAGVLFNPVSSGSGLADKVDQFRNYLDAYQPGTGGVASNEIDEILARNYKNKRLFSEHLHRMDLILGGIKWHQGNQTFSLTARSRIATRIEVGRGWYDEDLIERNGTSDRIRDMRLVQQTQFLYEFSLGYAQEFEFLKGLIPRLGRLYVGIAPKLVIAGSHLDLNYNTRYILGENMVQPELVQSMNYRSTGNFTHATQSYNRTGDAAAAIERNFKSSTLGNNLKEYTEPTGYGAGVDFGLTYVLPLGSDIDQISQENNTIPDKSIRLGFSVTDVGFISYTKAPLSFQREADTTFAELQNQTTTKFEGFPGQYISFFDDSGISLDPSGDNSSRKNLSSILPTSLNAGMLLKINRIKLAADLTLGLNDTAFNNTKLTGHFGLQYNPVDFIPVRIGTLLATQNATQWSLGTGIEMKHWELSVGTRFSTLTGSPGSELSGAAFGGLKFYF